MSHDWDLLPSNSVNEMGSKTWSTESQHQDWDRDLLLPVPANGTGMGWLFLLGMVWDREFCGILVQKAEENYIHIIYLFWMFFFLMTLLSLSVIEVVNKFQFNQPDGWSVCWPAGLTFLWRWPPQPKKIPVMLSLCF